jgi:hypothetical protein
MQTSFDRNKTLQELENISELAFNVSVPSDALRQKPLSDFTAEDLRNLISQQSSLSFLIPLALERLEVNPFARGEQHLGDLLLSVLRVVALSRGFDKTVTHPRLTTIGDQQFHQPR